MVGIERSTERVPIKGTRGASGRVLYAVTVYDYRAVRESKEKERELLSQIYTKDKERRGEIIHRRIIHPSPLFEAL